MSNQPSPLPASSARASTPRLSVAPMMDRTDRHFRYFIRQLSRHTLLYTEMIATAAVIHGDRAYLLGFDPREKPLALQLGGADPATLAECAKIAEDLGYDEVNLNVGCPSDRVQHAKIGACLMAEPELVAACVDCMRAAVAIPVTVKHRIGIDDIDSYEHLLGFVDTVAAAGCDRFTVHARKAWLHGLSPKENRTIPPLRYDEVYRLKRERPHLQVEINGGIRSVEASEQHLEHVDGVMIGRAAFDDPYLFATVDHDLFGDDAPPPSRREVLERMLPYVEHWLARGVRLHSITYHMVHLLREQPGARRWRRALAEESSRPGAGAQLLVDLLERA